MSERIKGVEESRKKSKNTRNSTASEIKRLADTANSLGKLITSKSVETFTFGSDKYAGALHDAENHR